MKLYSQNPQEVWAKLGQSKLTFKIAILQVNAFKIKKNVNINANKLIHKFNKKKFVLEFIVDVVIAVVFC